MENKKVVHQNTSTVTAGSKEVVQNEAVQKNSHQHNTPPQHLRLLQYGLKIPNHQHVLINQSHSHQLNSSLHHHTHQQVQFPQHRHIQAPSPQSNSTNYHLQNTQQYIHQHQQHNNTQNIYQLNQQPPLRLHPQFEQNTPQIWVPHKQQPIHYHQQPQKNNAQQSPQVQQQSNLKVKETSEKKKINVTPSKSLSAKRPLEAPVTMQGWLYKQGSDGLMLWKKRWFVLSEYCLFYYKSPDEEKILGSILLPSYKVSVCGPEDKVNKKFAFKCEHANMRTYVLAADSQELMTQWVQVLHAASLLQSNTETNRQQSTPVTNSFNRGANVEYRQHYSDNTPVHTHSSSNTTDLSNLSHQDRSHYNQPLYANAPPKPRRLNDGSYSSSSPDVTERYSNYCQVQSIPMMKNVSKSPMYGYVSVNSTSQSPRPEYMRQHRPNEYAFTPTREFQNVPQTTERRTPDTYGRSKLNPVKTLHPSDYEDIYADHTSAYKRPLSPLACSHVKKTTPVVNPSYRSYTPVHMFGPNDVMRYPPPNVQMRKSPVSVARPHSADFLEYELGHRQPNSSSLTKQQPRPKSSLDINRYTSDSDNYFYSEERYAEKMRKSAQYLPRMPQYYAEQKFPENESNFVLMRSSTQPIDFNSVQINEPQPIRSRSVLSEGSSTKELEVDMGSDRLQNIRESVSPAFIRQEQMYFDEMRHKEHEQFTRSASARLAHGSLQGDAKLMSAEGDRKREESMKRLLEWKQRMLQSPLNRKVQNHRVCAGKPQYYYKNQDSEFASKSQLNPYSNETKSMNSLPQYNSYSSDDEASGSISINTRDTFPKTVSSKRIWTPNSQPMQSRSVTNLLKVGEHENYMSHQQEYFPTQQEYFPKRQDCLDEQRLHKVKKENWSLDDKMNVSAGELLGRTHEELVLLLIQLRRQNSNTLQAIENSYNEIDTLQAQLHGSVLNQAKRLENLQKLEQIKQHLIELEKQYEKGKPLVNLVDNMVKLGSLYRSPHERTLLAPHIRNRLEFNQQIQERRLLAEEKRDWNRLNLNHIQLQEKVQQLYRLDKLIQEESGTLQNLQQDKEDIEKALGGLKHRLIKGFDDPAEIEEARKQQVNLENELSRVHLMLAQNSKKLEETVAGNARLEQELLILKQKLQMSRQQRSSPQFSNAGDSLPCTTGTTAMLESDLQRVQQKVGDLQKQRQELSLQVRQLTDRSNSLQQQIKYSPSVFVAQNHQSTGNKKKVNSFWRETDLDTMNTIDHGDVWDNQAMNDLTKTPLYVNTDLKQSETELFDRNVKLSDSTSDDTLHNVNPLHEKQEIKTVRIVKRESERRQRDREKCTTGKWDALLEEDTSSQNSSVLFRPTSVQKTPSSSNIISPTYEVEKNVGNLSRQSSLSSPSLPQIYSDSTLSPTNPNNKTLELSPIFKSEAARQIITEISNQDEFPKYSKRRAVPKEKRRHYTAPHNNLIMKSLNHLPTDDNVFDKIIADDRRARDDLDMERALRQRIDAPDVVRSTLSSKELKYNENTIDNILGTPNKISIPERYIPEQLPQLSVEEQEHRLRKVESIKKMLSDAAIISTSSSNPTSDEKSSKTPNSVTNKATSKMIEEKKQREHLLQLNQILAKQVMEMSKIVAGTSNPDDQ